MRRFCHIASRGKPAPTPMVGDSGRSGLAPRSRSTGRIALRGKSYRRSHKASGQRLFTHPLLNPIQQGIHQPFGHLYRMQGRPQEALVGRINIVEGFVASVVSAA